MGAFMLRCSALGGDTVRGRYPIRAPANYPSTATIYLSVTLHIRTSSPLISPRLQLVLQKTGAHGAALCLCLVHRSFPFVMSPLVLLPLFCFSRASRSSAVPSLLVPNPDISSHPSPAPRPFRISHIRHRTSHACSHLLSFCRIYVASHLFCASLLCFSIFSASLSFVSC
ncbi:hypothetical protein DFH07DRAFT_845968, partial [Mycena maculata]